MRVVLFVCALMTSTAFANDWRTYAGSFGSRWNTHGHHGHDQPPCPAENCDRSDFARANLDDSIGFRIGRERDVFRAGALHVLAGADASISHTEYNLSQRDFSIVSATLFGGAELEFGGMRAGARYGAGGYVTTSDDERGLLRYWELSATLPLRGGAALRIGRRRFALARMDAAPSREVSVALVAADPRGGESRWEFLAATGTTVPGGGVGGDRKLRRTAVNRTAALWSARRRDVQLELSWSSTAHESSLPSVFRGYDGNYRGKTIEGYGVALARGVRLNESLSMRWSGGIEIADWSDEHQLLTRDGKELVAGLEFAWAAAGALRMQLRPRLAIETSMQKLYWRNIDLAELRWTAGIVLTR